MKPKGGKGFAAKNGSSFGEFEDQIVVCETKSFFVIWIVFILFIHKDFASQKGEDWNFVLCVMYLFYLEGSGFNAILAETISFDYNILLMIETEIANCTFNFLTAKH